MPSTNCTCQKYLTVHLHKFLCMRKWFLVVVLFFIFMVAAFDVAAQCSICTKTAQQLGEKPAKALNSGILYLAFMPMAIIGYLGFRWWKNNKVDQPV